MPSIADLYVQVMPETSKIADGIVRAFREVDPKATEAGRRWGREIQRGMDDVKVELKADTAKAQAQIDEAAKDKKATVEVGADTAKAEAQIDAVARDRKATIEVNSDVLMSSVTRSFSQAAPQMSQSLASVGAQAAPQVGGSLSTAMGPVGMALSAALIAGGATAIAGIAASLSGVVGLIPAGLAGAGSVIGTLVTGLDGVKDAWDAAGKAAESSGKDQEAKAKAVASAQKSLRDAVLDEANAQKDVANARRDARQQLEDLNVQLRGGVIDEKQAILDAQAARRDLQTGRFRDSIEYEQAQLRVEAADQRVLESHERNVQLQGKAAEANARGVDQSDQVVAANQRLVKAQEDVAAAQQKAAEAQASTSSNADAFAAALGKLSPNAQKFINTLQGLKPAWEQLKFSVQDALFAGVGPEIQALATQYLPVLKGAMTGLAGTMNSAFKDIGAWLAKPETMASIQQIVANIGSSFKIWSESLVPFSQAFLTITQVGSGFLPELAKMVTDGANAFNNFIQQAAQSGDLQQWMQTGIGALREMVKLVPIVGKMFLDFAPVGIPTLQTIGMLLRDLEPVFERFGQAMAIYQIGVNEFWGSVGRLNEKFSSLVQEVWPPLKAMLESLEQTFARVFDNVAKVIDTAWRIIKPILDTIGSTLKTLGLDTLLKTLGGLMPGGLPNLPGTPPPGGSGGVPSAGGPAGAAGSIADGAGGAGGAPKLSDLRSGRARLPSGFNWDAVMPHEGGTWNNADTGHNGHFGGLQFSPETWSAYGGLDIAPRADMASPEQQKMVADRVAFYGWNGKPPQGLGAWEAITKGMVPGITTGSVPTTLPSAVPTQVPVPVKNPTGSAGEPVKNPVPARPGVAAAVPALPVPAAPATIPTGGDESLLARIPAGRYLQTQAADLTQGIGDCSSAVEDLINMLDGVSTAGRQMSTSNASQWLTAHGFVPTSVPVPGAFNVGFNSEHMQATLPGGTPFNWGSDAAAAQRGIGGTGAFDPSFTAHYYRPADSGAFPSAGMPTIASPNGLSLGTQQSPMYVMPAQSSGAQQFGQDFLGGFLEIFGLDGSVFKNPLGSGLFKGFKGIMSMLSGGGQGGGGGYPASAFGGDGASLPLGGGSGPLGGLGGILSGFIPAGTAPGNDVKQAGGGATFNIQQQGMFLDQPQATDQIRQAAYTGTAWHNSMTSPAIMA